MKKKKFNPENWVDIQSASSVPDITEPSVSNSESPNDIETIVSRVEAAHIDIAPTYADWRDLGFAIADALGEPGRAYYHRLSCFYNGYSPEETDKQYTSCLNAHGHGVTIKTLFHLAKQAGIDVACQSFIEKKLTFQSNSSKSSKSSGEEIEEIEEMPTFSQIVNNSLPNLLAQIVKCANSAEDADLLLLGSLTVFSSCLPQISGTYCGREVFPNLFVFVTAQASAGKGRLTLCRHLIQPIHDNLKQVYAVEMDEYKHLQSEYVRDKKNNEPPQEPPLKTLLIPANSSSTAVYQILNDNNGIGLIFETEGDTLSNTFKSDYGNFSDGFRKAFHHEMISYTRRKEKEFVELPKPRLSALLSGTPRQILSLIPDAENGLFSRFIFYYMNVRLEWQNVFANSDNTLDNSFEQFGLQFYDLYKWLQKYHPIRFSLSAPQEAIFNAFFEQIQKEYSSIYGLDIIASVRRLGLITFRIAMILSSIRIIDKGQESDIMVCEDSDFQSSLSIVKVLIQHTAKIFSSLPTLNAVPNDNGKTVLKQNFLDYLPPEFDRKMYIDIAKKLNIPTKTAERYIGKFVSEGQLKHLSHGSYSKA